MREELLRKIIRTKIEMGMYVMNELPHPIQQRAQKMITILQEELTSYIQEQKQPAETSLNRVTIE
ncbi:DUF3926 domain-containing protein [Bacillus sp. JJ864]|uniref:DUF3926 domain-containing protein n=1 Tax=Bacillus sp. JJ864 TaxID=3122975 RepID=UPI002FFF05B6